ncbi:hypothetical protein [Algoriphagus confluentis]|uniref:Lipoprotein n=1 Tax=Algoriphagus confluentis TaxID=1697556 RepID=A0ABQ6PJI8_9BACT|nr:hypothetical protein Aconfl_07700 [Algoriphagus confluentis]
MKKVIGILLVFVSVFSSCGSGSEEDCFTLSELSDQQSLDTLLIASPNRNSIYHAELRFSGEVKDTMSIAFESNFQLKLAPGKYDSLIYKGDWYGDPMVVKTSGGEGSVGEFCARFFY